MIVRAELRDGQQPGVMVVESVWKDGFKDGVGINALTSADRAPPKGDTAVRLRPERQGATRLDTDDAVDRLAAISVT